MRPTNRSYKNTMLAPSEISGPRTRLDPASAMLSIVCRGRSIHPGLLTSCLHAGMGRIYLYRLLLLLKRSFEFLCCCFSICVRVSVVERSNDRRTAVAEGELPSHAQAPPPPFSAPSSAQRTLARLSSSPSSPLLPREASQQRRFPESGDEAS